MREKITITPEQVEEMARHFVSGGEQSRQIMARLQQSVQSLEQDWEGVSKQRFVQDFQEADKQMQALARMLESIALELNALANRFRLIDQTRI